MPILAGLIAAVVTALATFFANILTKKIALGVALLVAVIALTSAIYLTIEGLFTAITYAMPSFVQDGACWLLPSNLQACITAMVLAKIAQMAYIWNVKVLQWKLL